MLCSFGSLVFAGLIILFFSPGARLRAQTDSTPGILGEVFGSDVSVIGPSHVVSGDAGRAIEFSSGGTIVVFSGKARVKFTGGGEMDVCGPAKFTVLSSGQALTVALSFGRVHVRFGALRPVIIYTALVVATPVPIGDQPRDATIGLTNTGTMCVLAAQGAVRLQNQLSGESAIVPQPSEVFVPGSSFASLPAAAGQCDCDFNEPFVQQSAPVVTTPSNPAPRMRSSSLQVPQQFPRADALILANRPSTFASQFPASGSETPPATSAPAIGSVARSATAAAEPISVATLMLAQQAVVQPEWIFQGTVIDSAKRRNHATKSNSFTQTGGRQQKSNKRGFWAKFRHFFSGS